MLKSSRALNIPNEDQHLLHQKRYRWESNVVSGALESVSHTVIL